MKAVAAVREQRHEAVKGRGAGGLSAVRRVVHREPRAGAQPAGAGRGDRGVPAAGDGPRAAAGPHPLPELLLIKFFWQQIASQGPPQRPLKSQVLLDKQAHFSREKVLCGQRVQKLIDCEIYGLALPV